MGTKTIAPTFPDEALRKTHQLGGDWFEYDFQNGYGASVVRNGYSYGGPEGMYEVAVTHSGPLCYATPVTSDVIGWLGEARVTETLAAIAALPANTDCGHRS